MDLHADADRLERIDRLADRMLLRRGEDRPATEVWDEARDIIDRRDHEALIRRLDAEREERENG